MKYLLDTNICIHFFRGKYKLDEKFKTIGLFNCAISEITLAELVYGAEKSSNTSKNLDLIEQFTDKITILPIYDGISFYGKEKARMKKQGNAISDFDLLIGSTSIVFNLVMVTENTKEFERISRIKLENWVERD